MKTATISFAAFVAILGEDLDEVINRHSEVNGKTIRSADDEVTVYIKEDAYRNNWAISEPRG